MERRPRGRGLALGIFDGSCSAGLNTDGPSRSVMIVIKVLYSMQRENVQMLSTVVCFGVCSGLYHTCTLIAAYRFLIVVTY